MLHFHRRGALLLALIVLAVLASACTSSGSAGGDMDGGVDDGGVDGGPLDSDFDGVPDDEDPCSTTLANATQLTPGCSATDIIQDERHLLAPIDDGVKEIRSIAGVPPAVLDGLEEARLALGVAVRAFVDDDPCMGVPGFQSVVDLIDGANMEMQDFLTELESVIPPAPAGAMLPDEVNHEASRYLIWTLHADKVTALVDDANEALSLVTQVCDQEMGTRTVNGIVQSIHDDLRVVVLRSGEVIFLGPNIVEDGEHRMGQGREVSIEGIQLADVLLGTRITTMPSPFIILPDHLTYNGCLQLRVTLRPDIAGPDPLPLDGFFNDKGYYDFERGMSIGAQSRGCPTEQDLEGQGPGGVDMKIIYAYQLVLEYTDGLGQPRTRIMAFQHGDADTPLRAPILFPPNIDPDTPATLKIWEFTSTCVPDPEFGEFGQPNRQSGEIGPAEPVWDCSDEVLLEFDDPTVYVRQPGDFCDVGYDKPAFKLEDDEYSTWEPAMVAGMLVHSDLPLPVTFAAVGPKIINGTPVQGETVGRNEPFAMYGSFLSPGQRRTSPGLAGAHITGTRNGQPFAHVCTLPQMLVRDGIDTGPSMPCAFYRLPYPNGVSVKVNQGNGGTASHNVGKVQEWALDLSGDQGDPLVAARGGKVVRVVNGVTLSCPYCGVLSFPPCPQSCPPYGNHVAIEHQDGDVSWYMHLLSSGLQVGQYIQRGAPIGLLGTTGRSTAPHLHFQATASLETCDDMDVCMVNWQTVPIQYEIGGNCLVPAEDQTYISTNEPN